MTNAGKIIFGVWNNSATIITSSGSYNDGNWHHIVATQGPSGMALYIDGNKVGSNNVTTNQNITGYWRVGGDNLTNWPSQPSNKWFNGQIDDVAVYPAALTPTQIVDHYTISGRSFTPPPNQTSAYAQLIRGDSPTNYYRLDETGGVVANDLSGNGNDGTFASGITFSQTGALPSDPDTAALFNGTSNGRLNSNALAPAPTVYSEELWFKTALGYIKGGKLIGYGNAKTSASTSYDRQVYMTNAGKLIFGVYTGTTRTITSTGTYNDGKWHYVVATQGPSGMALYVDGALIGSNGVTGNQSYNGYLRVGGDSLANWPNAPQSNYFNGTIDEVATYAYALTPAQVSKHYQVGLS
jgi:hypothetical protein